MPEEISRPRVVAIGRGLPADRVERIAEGLVAGGIRAFEITLNSADALGAIAALAGRWGQRLLVGAGRSSTRMRPPRPSTPVPASSSAPTPTRL